MLSSTAISDQPWRRSWISGCRSGYRIYRNSQSWKLFTSWSLAISVSLRTTRGKASWERLPQVIPTSHPAQKGVPSSQSTLVSSSLVLKLTFLPDTSTLRFEHLIVLYSPTMMSRYFALLKNIALHISQGFDFLRMKLNIVNSNNLQPTNLQCYNGWRIPISYYKTGQCKMLAV